MFILHMRYTAYRRCDMAQMDVTGQAAATDEECYGQCCGLTCDRPIEECAEQACC
jgi:hypothetical protein